MRVFLIWMATQRIIKDQPKRMVILRSINIFRFQFTNIIRKTYKFEL